MRNVWDSPGTCSRSKAAIVSCKLKHIPFAYFVCLISRYIINGFIIIDETREISSEVFWCQIGSKPRETM